MSGLKKILYLGKDSLYAELISKFSQENFPNSSEFTESLFSEGALIDLSLRTNPSICFIDLSEKINLEILFSEIAFLKETVRFKSIIFAALVPTNDEALLRLIYSSGFSIAQIKGQDTDLFLTNSFYITFGLKTSNKRYAKANINNVPIDAYFQASLCAISERNIIIETDLVTTDGSIYFQSIQLETFSDKPFYIEHQFNNNFNNNFTDSFISSIPLKSEWNKEETTCIDKKIISEVLDSSEVSEFKEYVYLYSSNYQIMPEIYYLSKNCDYRISYYDSIPENSESNSLLSKQPQLIFLDLDNENNINIEEFFNVITSISATDSYAPIIVLSNTPSTSTALQKLFNYERIIAVKEKMSLDMLKMFLNNYNTKSVYNNLEGFKFFNQYAFSRAITQKKQLEVLSLTEEIIELKSDVEIPYFSVLCFNVPIKFHATIVPTSSEATNNKTYHALIHSIDEKDRQILRRFINQCIYEPLESFEPQKVNQVLNNEKDIPTPVVEEVVEEKIDDTAIEKTLFKRPKLKGKSKI